jgi:hypothetical protein
MNPRKNRKRAIPNDVAIFVSHSMAVPKQIEMILKSQGKNHSYLAHILDKSESEISKWMCGTHNFTFKTISKIEDKLGESLIKCPYEYKWFGNSTIIDLNITANSNADMVNQFKNVKPEVINKHGKTITISLKSVSIQENDSTIAIPTDVYNN